MKKVGVFGYCWVMLVYAYMFGPSIVVAVYSFNSAAIFGMTFEGWTPRWFAALADHPEFVDAILVSGEVATFAALIGVVIGTPAAFAIVRRAFPLRDGLVAFFLSPIVVPQIVIGVALLQMIPHLGMPAGKVALILSHGVFVSPYVMRAVITSLTRFDRQLEEAAMSLGAGPWRALGLITLPLLRPGLVAGLVFAFVMSFVNVPLSLFLTTPTVRTLPIQLLNYLETRFDAIPAAIATVIMAGITVAIIVLERGLKIRFL